MALRTLRVLSTDESGHTCGVTIPKDDLVLEGLVEDGELKESVPAKVTKEGEGRWSIEVLDREKYPGLAD